MRMLSALALTVTLTIVGCACKPSPEHFIAGNKNTVCILSENTAFRKEVASKVTRALEAKGRTVVSDSTKNAGHYRAVDYGAVVYVAEYRAWHTPRHAVRYFKRNDKAPNIVFVITSGDPKLTVKKPFDAVTTASELKNTDHVANEIMTRLDAVLE